jgi:molybdopterin-biosynthesis enzyme MoeA-like protein
VLIDNPVSRAPGFMVGNVFVLAGVPSIMRGMLLGVGPHIKGGAVVVARTLRCKGLREGDVAAGLEALEKKYDAVTFGSYPWFSAEGIGAHLVARSADPAALAAAMTELAALVRSFGVDPEPVEES